MNDVVKMNIKGRLEKALHTECLTGVSAARMLKTKAEYLSQIKNPKTWDKCPISAWELLLKWINSGQGIVEYGEKHGSVIAPAKEIPQSEISMPLTVSLVRTKPGVLEKRGKEIGFKQNNNEQLISCLEREKELLQIKIAAIDVLLKHYKL